MPQARRERKINRSVFKYMRIYFSRTNAESGISGQNLAKTTLFLLLTSSNLAWAAPTDPATADVQAITLKPDQFKSIFFDDIAPTKYHFKEQELIANVNNSASALVLPFNKAIDVTSMTVEWQSLSGKIQWQNPSQQKSKAGDDAYWRIGVMLAGDAPMIPFFASAWIKKVRSFMNLESNQLVYLIVGSPLPDGSTWPSPYSDSITNRAIPSKPLSDKWQAASWRFDEKKSVVGLWIMADGDNTNSTFKAKLRSLKLFSE